jgi:hypothetical protein
MIPDELPAATCWPTIAAHPLGRLVGRLAAIPLGMRPLTLGNLLALATIPLSLAVFAWQLMPYLCRRYTLTSRRVVIRKGFSAVPGPAIGLDEFDTIDVEVLPGQAWFHAGELVFRRGPDEVFRLSGVSRPEIFRCVCLKVRDAMLAVRNAIPAPAGHSIPVEG